MTEIAFQGGGPVFKDGKVAAGSACCCVAGGACCVAENCYLFHDVRFFSNSISLPICQRAYPATVSGWSKESCTAVNSNTAQLRYSKRSCGTTEQACADGFEAEASAFRDAMYQWWNSNRVQVGLSGYADGTGQVQLPRGYTWFPASCVDGLDQEQCEAQCGTYHPGQTCADEPCGGCNTDADCAAVCFCVRIGFAFCSPFAVVRVGQVDCDTIPPEWPRVNRVSDGQGVIPAGPYVEIQNDTGEEFNSVCTTATTVGEMHPCGAPIIFENQILIARSACCNGQCQQDLEPCVAGECSAFECFAPFGEQGECPQGCNCIGWDPNVPEIPGSCNANEFP